MTKVFLVMLATAAVRRYTGMGAWVYILATVSLLIDELADLFDGDSKDTPCASIPTVQPQGVSFPDKAC